MELKIGSLYEVLYRSRHALAMVTELSDEEVSFCYLAHWSQQGYWRLLHQAKVRRLAHSLFLRRLARARPRKRRRLPEPPIEENGIYEIKVKQEIRLAKIRRNARGKVEIERVGQLLSDGSYLGLPGKVTVLPIRQFRRLQRSAYEWRAA